MLLLSRGVGDATGLIELLNPLECILCLFHSRLKPVPINVFDEIVSRICELLRSNLDRTELFVKSFRDVVEVLGRDPYDNVREQLNTRGLKLARTLLGKRLDVKTILELIALGNILDVDMPDHRLEVESLKLTRTGALHFIPTNITDLVEKSKRVAIVLDNAGEAVVDIVLAHKLKEHGKEVVLVARSGRYEIDVIVDDVKKLLERLGLEFEVRGTGSDYPVFHSEKCYDILHDVDLVVAKGIANLESYLVGKAKDLEGKVVLVLSAKCKPIARLLGVNLKDHVVIWDKYLLELYSKVKCS